MRQRTPHSRKSNARHTPRVLLVDDHPKLLESVTTMLAEEFVIAGTAADGHQALSETRRLEPDVIVLDISMPGLNGFQTARALRQSGSRTPIVFLSTHDGDDCVEAAFASGGRGFVSKTRLQPDLASAIDHVLAGRLFVPSLGSMSSLADSGGGHSMHVYRDGRSLVHELADFLNHALRRGDAVYVIGEPPLRLGVEAHLRECGWNADGSSCHSRYRSVDVDDATNSMMRDGFPEEARIADAISDLDRYRLSVAEGPDRRLTIFGNMSAHLSLRGDADAAITMERSWNRLTARLPFLTVCGYPTESFHGTLHPDLFATVCDSHGAVGHAHAI